MAKGDKTRHSLSVTQLNAIDLLVLGKTDHAVAQTIGVSRLRVSLWKLHHPDFQAALNQRRRAVWGAAADKLRSLLPQAVKVIEQELTGIDRLKAALTLVKIAAMPLGALGPTDANVIVAEEAAQQDARRLSNLSRLADLELVRRDMIRKAEAEAEPAAEDTL
jgi:hypothetical protein